MVKKTKKQIGKASKNKGKVGEREVAALLRQRGWESRRGVQFQGGNDSPDVVTTLPDVHIEVKRTETLSLYKALEQAIEDAGEGKIPTVWHRRNQKQWVVALNASDFLDLMDEIINARI